MHKAEVALGLCWAKREEFSELKGSRLNNLKSKLLSPKVLISLGVTALLALAGTVAYVILKPSDQKVSLADNVINQLQTEPPKPPIKPIKRDGQ